MSESRAPRIVECVPNISEGRDSAKIETVVEAARAVPGVSVIDVDPGRETNRTVITIVGEPEAVKEAAFRLIRRAAEVIDMRTHQGAHARHGATDVCPFVPVSGVTMEDCARLAAELGERVGGELGIPVYLYDQAARRPERRSLAAVRKGEYEALADKLGKPEWEPDFGPAKFLPETGVVTIGAREFLIAYNLNLNSRHQEDATDIAFDLRDAGRIARGAPYPTPRYMSGRIKRYRPSAGEFPCAYCETVSADFDALAAHYGEHDRDLREELVHFGLESEELEGKEVMKRGLFRECRAVGWTIPEYGRAQVSINLTDYKVTNMHDVVDAGRRIGQERGIAITGSEVVGVVPFDAIRRSGEHYLKAARASRGVPVRDLVETAVQSLGLREIGGFDVDQSVLGLPKLDGPLVSMSVAELCDEVSRATPAPGGGSISALAGSLGAALAAMAANLTHVKPKHADDHDALEEIAIRGQEVKDELLRAVDADTEAFNSVIAAMRMSSETKEQAAERKAAIQEGYKQATLVPLRSAELCLEALRLARRCVDLCMAASASDAGVAGLVAHAGLRGSVYNVRINLGEIADEAWVAGIRSKLGALTEEGRRLDDEIDAALTARMEG